jgi:hypothetical protein
VSPKPSASPGPIVSKPSSFTSSTTILKTYQCSDTGS